MKETSLGEVRTARRWKTRKETDQIRYISKVGHQVEKISENKKCSEFSEMPTKSSFLLVSDR